MVRMNRVVSQPLIGYTWEEMQALSGHGHHMFISSTSAEACTRERHLMKAESDGKASDEGLSLFGHQDLFQHHCEFSGVVLYEESITF